MKGKNMMLPMPAGMQKMHNTMTRQKMPTNMKKGAQAMMKGAYGKKK